MAKYTPSRIWVTVTVGLALICLIFLPSILSANRQIPAPDKLDAPLFYLKYLEFKKEINGQASQTFELIYPENTKDIQVLFQEDGASDLYSITPKKGKLTITGSRKRLIRVYAFGQTDRYILTSSASFFLWGNSKAPTGWAPAEQDAVKIMSNLPFVVLSPSKGHYWPQTGQLFRFYLSRNIPGNLDFSGPIRVLERESIRPLLADGIHVPSHDIILNRQGGAAFRQDIIFVDVTDDSKNIQASYSLKLHRSRTAQDDHPTGWITLGGSLAFFAGWIVIKRRQPWWND